MKRTKIQFGKIQLNAPPKDLSANNDEQPDGIDNSSTAGFGTFGGSSKPQAKAKPSKAFTATPIDFDAEDAVAEDTKEMAAVMGISSFGRKAQEFDIIVSTCRLVGLIANWSSEFNTTHLY